MPLFSASVINRYLGRRFLALLVTTLIGFILLYLVVDLFDRLDILLRNRAGIAATLRYFAFKVPLVITQITPPAVITAVLLTFASIGRRNEIIALRASGVGLGQTSIPIFVLTIGICLAAVAWQEMVVPYSSRQFQYVNNVEIRKRQIRGVLSDRAIWYHGADGFYNIEYVDRARRTVYGLTVFRLDDNFQLYSVITATSLEWVDRQWVATDVMEYVLGDLTQSQTIPRERLSIPESIDDFLEVQREPEELSFTELRERISTLTRRGISASHYLADLYLKTAVPFASLALAAVAVPIAGRLRRRVSTATIIALGTAAGFSYWVVLGIGTALGQSGMVSPLLGAWCANGIYLLVGVAMFLWSD